MAISVLIVDDSTTIRAMLEEVLGREEDIALIGSVPDGHSAIAMIHRHHPDVTTIDVAMPGMDGLTLLDHVYLLTNAVMLTSHREVRRDSLERGAMGFFDKRRIFLDTKKLLRLVRSAAEGKAARAG